MFQTLTDYVFILSTRKKQSNYVSTLDFKKIYFNGFRTNIFFKIIRTTNFSAVKKVLIFSHIFSQARKFFINKSSSLIKEIFYKQRFLLNQRSFPLSKEFLQTKIKEFSLSQDFRSI